MSTSTSSAASLPTTHSTPPIWRRWPAWSKWSTSPRAPSSSRRRAPLSHFYVVRSGEVEVVDRGRVVDVLGPGETFGQISVLSGLPPPLTVRAAEDTLCYRFPDPRPHPAASGTTAIQPLRLAGHPRTAGPLRAGRSGVAARRATRCARSCGARRRPPSAEAAAAMTDAGQSCALIQRGEQIGIVTDSDFRTGLAAGTLDRPHARSPHWRRSRPPPSAPTPSSATRS